MNISGGLWLSNGEAHSNELPNLVSFSYLRYINRGLASIRPVFRLGHEIVLLEELRSYI